MAGVGGLGLLLCDGLCRPAAPCTGSVEMVSARHPAQAGQLRDTCLEIGMVGLEEQRGSMQVQAAAGYSELSLCASQRPHLWA